MSTLKSFRWPSLTIRTKLLLLVGVLAAVATLIGYTLIQQQRADIKRARQEASGVEYLNRVQNLLEYVSEHRTLAYLNLQAGLDNQQRLTELEGQVETEINSLGALQRGGIEVADTLATIQRNWSVLVTRAAAMNAQQSFDAHSRLIEDIGNHALLAGERTGLRTTPDPAVSYLADALLENLVPSIDKLGQLQALSVATASTPASTPTSETVAESGNSPDRIALSDLVEGIAADSELIVNSLEVAFT